MDVTQLALTWLGRPNGEKLALTWVQIWSRPKWAQVIASARQAWPNGSRPKFSTCFYLRLRLARALKPWRQIENERFGCPSQVFYFPRVVAISPHKFFAGTTQSTDFCFRNNVFYFVGFRNECWLRRLWNLLYRWRHEVGLHSTGLYRAHS